MGNIVDLYNSLRQIKFSKILLSTVQGTNASKNNKTIKVGEDAEIGAKVLFSWIPDFELVKNDV